MIAPISPRHKLIIADLWRNRKLDTFQIAKLLSIPEHQVANLLYEWRERRYAARAAA